MNKDQGIGSTLMQQTIRQLNCKSEPKDAFPLQIGMWNCAQDLYVKSMVGTESKDPNDEDWKSVTEADLEKAKARRRLVNFDVILITEWMKYPEVSKYLSKSFGVSPGISFEPMAKYVHTDQVQKYNAQLQAYPRNLNKQGRQILLEYNTQDSKLFEFAKELSLARMRQAGFTSFVPPGYAKDAQAPVYNPSLSPAGKQLTQGFAINLKVPAIFVHVAHSRFRA